MTPSQAFLLITGVVLAVLLYRLTPPGPYAKRRPSGEIAEHSDSYWSTRR